MDCRIYGRSMLATPTIHRSVDLVDYPTKSRGTGMYLGPIEQVYPWNMEVP